MTFEDIGNTEIIYLMNYVKVAYTCIKFFSSWDNAYISHKTRDLNVHIEKKMR